MCRGRCTCGGGHVPGTPPHPTTARAAEGAAHSRDETWTGGGGVLIDGYGGHSFIHSFIRTLFICLFIWFGLEYIFIKNGR